MQPFRPEGLFAAPPGFEDLQNSIASGEIFRAMCVKCDEYHNLHVDLGDRTGIIPREEAALGLAEGKIREIAILSRVGKPVSFQVMALDRDGKPVLSRRRAQLEAKSYFLSALRPGDVIPAVVLNPADFGLFCDIGCGVTALMRIDRCCVSRLRTTKDLFRPGQEISAVLLSVDDTEGLIYLTGRELLGTWEENTAGFAQGQTVTGTVRSIMPYGAFVELTPNLSGLAETLPDLQEGDRVSVFIRSILPQKHKIKLSILEILLRNPHPDPMNFYITQGHLDQWEYYPGSSNLTYF